MRDYGNSRRKQLTVPGEIKSSRMRKIRWDGQFFFFVPSFFFFFSPHTKSTKSLLESHCFWIKSFISFSFWCFQTYRPLRQVQHQWFTTWFSYQLAWCYLLCVDGYFVGPWSISSEAIQSSISFSLATREYSSFTILLVSLKKLFGSCKW